MKGSLIFLFIIIFMRLNSVGSQAGNDSILIHEIDSLYNILQEASANYQVKINKLSVPMDSSKLLQNEIYIFNTKPVATKFNQFRDYFPWLLSILSLFVAYFAFERNSRFKNYDFVAEVNRQLISYPELNAFYDSSKPDYPGFAHLDDRLRSFSYFKLNNFESVLQNLKWKYGSREFIAWHRYLVDTYITSSVFRETVDEGLGKNFFGPVFSEMLRNCKDFFKLLKENFQADIFYLENEDINEKYENHFNSNGSLKMNFYKVMYLIDPKLRTVAWVARLIAYLSAFLLLVFLTVYALYSIIS